MKKWLFGILIVFLGLIACNKNDFERNNNSGIGINDLNELGIENIDAREAFAYGTHVFTSNSKANPDNLESLNITNNRWGWAINQNLTEVSTQCIQTKHRLLWIATYGTYYSGWATIYNDNENIYVKFEATYNPFISYLGNSFVVTINSINIFTFNPELVLDPEYQTMALPNPYIAIIPCSSIQDFIPGDPIFVSVLTYLRENFTDGTHNYAPVKNIYDKYAPSAPNETTPVQTCGVQITSINYPIYMGAALNDTTKGTQVGVAYVEYDGDELKVKCDLFDEYTIKELHIYSKDTAPETIAPEQFRFTKSFETPVNEFETILDVADTNGDNKIWLIIHASVVKL